MYIFNSKLGLEFSHNIKVILFVYRHHLSSYSKIFSTLATLIKLDLISF